MSDCVDNDCCRGRSMTNLGRSSSTSGRNSSETPSDPEKDVNVPHSWTMKSLSLGRADSGLDASPQAGAAAAATAITGAFTSTGLGGSPANNTAAEIAAAAAAAATGSTDHFKARMTNLLALRVGSDKEGVERTGE